MTKNQNHTTMDMLILPPAVEACLFLCLTKQTRHVARLLDTLHSFTREAPIRVSSEGLTIKTTDPDKLTFTHVILDAPAFDRYYINLPSGAIEFGVCIDTMRNLLRNLVAQDSICLFVTKDQPDKMGISTYSSQTHTRHIHSMGLLKFPFKNFVVPDTPCDWRVRVNSSHLREAIHQISYNRGTSIGFALSDNGLLLHSKGDFSQTTLSAPILSGGLGPSPPPSRFTSKDSPSVVDASTKATSPMTFFPLKVVDKFSKSFSLSALCDISVINDGLLTMNFHIGSLGAIIYMIAPYVEPQALVPVVPENLILFNDYLDEYAETQVEEDEAEHTEDDQ